MNSERAQAYGRVIKTLEDMAAAKLQGTEQERIRTAADTLLFSESPDAPGAREAIEDLEALVRPPDRVRPLDGGARPRARRRRPGLRARRAAGVSHHVTWVPS